MYTNPYLAEQLARQRRQQFVDQAARDQVATQLTGPRSKAQRVVAALRRLLMLGNLRLTDGRQSGAPVSGEQ